MTFHSHASRPAAGSRRIYKMGRSGNPRVVITFDEDDMLWLSERAQKLDKPFAAIIREAIRDYRGRIDAA